MCCTTMRAVFFYPSRLLCDMPIYVLSRLSPLFHLGFHSLALLNTAVQICAHPRRIYFPSRGISRASVRSPQFLSGCIVISIVAERRPFDRVSTCVHDAQVYESLRRQARGVASGSFATFLSRPEFAELNDSFVCRAPTAPPRKFFIFHDLILQIFVCDPARGCSPPLTRAVRLSITDNHGHSNYTCIYNVKVFGKVARGDSEPSDNVSDSV
jgi:hypothetical protein